MLSNSSGSSSSQEPITPPAMSVTNTTVGMVCKWKDCDYLAPSPDNLYEHLCNAHIGRKSTNNLCLVCAWEGCGVKCVKRDHITSHLRVHTPLKPHTCAVCPKTFKRPQDLKKHERIHTQEHHQLHKHSKAATTDDPTFARRVVAASYGLPSQAAMNSLSPASLSSQSVSPTSSHSQILGGGGFPTSPYEHLMPSADASHSPIPPPALAALHRKQHEELAAYQARELLVLQQLANQQAQSGGTGAKRGWQDETINHFDGFYADMKKRRMEPVYDAGMIDRLNSLVPPSLGHANGNGNAYPGMPYFTPHFQTQPQQAQAYPPPPPPTNFHPHAQSFQPDIRSESDLAMFNQFMVTLGRDASGYNGQMEHSSSGSSSSASGDDLFDHEALASLGLTGMPGIPDVGQHTPPANGTVNFGSLYPSLDLGLANRRNTSPGPGLASGDVTKRAIAGLPRATSSSTFGLNHNHRSASLSDGSTSGFYEDTSSLYDFDSLARARGPALPSAHVAPKEFYRKNFRAVEPLGAARPVARESAERSGIEEEDEEEEAENVSPPLPLKALLNDDEGNPAYKLAAISISRSSQSPSSSTSRDSSPLPSIDAALHAGLKRPTTADGLARQVKRLEIDVDTHLARPEDSDEGEITPVAAGVGLTEREKRRLHALWIRAVVVRVNEAFRLRQVESGGDSGESSGTEKEFEREKTPSVVAC